VGTLYSHGYWDRLPEQDPSAEMQQDEAGLKSFQGVQVDIKNGTKTMTGWWFGTFFLFFHILGIIIPTDFHIFQRV
jgi:hypothetical protein